MQLVGEIHRNSKKKVVGLVAASCLYVVGKLCLRWLWTDSEEYTSTFLICNIKHFYSDILWKWFVLGSLYVSK